MKVLTKDGKPILVDGKMICVDEVTQISDVKIKGESVVVDGVVNIPTATWQNLGVIKTAASQGISVNDATGQVFLVKATDAEIEARAHNYHPIVPSSLEKAVTSVVDFQTGESEEVTFVEERDLAEYVKNTDYASGTRAGVLKTTSVYGSQTTTTGNLAGASRSSAQYETDGNGLIISKGTLENILVPYAKNAIIETLADTTISETAAFSVNFPNAVYAIAQVTLPENTTCVTQYILFFCDEAKAFNAEFAGLVNPNAKKQVGRVIAKQEFGHWMYDRYSFGLGYWNTINIGGFGPSGIIATTLVSTYPYVNKVASEKTYPAGTNIKVLGIRA